MSFCAGGRAVRRRGPRAGAQQPRRPRRTRSRRAAKPEQKPEPKPDEPQKYEETVVVSASRTEEKLINAPATMTVIGPQTIQSAPTQNFAELLRTVPGVNITQVSARDINVTSRGATGTLATGQLALLDGRSLYQDFFGFVMWDFLPVNLNEIKQVEVIRGPASAVWGANALNGVVNVITKSPREMQGTSAILGVGGFDRQSGTTATSRAPARCSTSAARTRRRSTIASRSRSPAAATRRIRTRGRPARFRAIAPKSCTVTRNDYPELLEPGHHAAEVRRARRLRLSRRQAS